MLRRRAAGPIRVVAVLLAAFVVMLSLLAACTGEEPAEPDAGSGAEPPPPVSGGSSRQSASPEPESEQGPVVVHTRVTRVVGHLSEERQEAVARKVGRLLSAYVEGAVRGGAGSRGAFVAFTPGAAREARADAAVLAGLGGAADGADASDVGVPSARAWISVLSPRGRIVGATARLAIIAQPAGGDRAVQLTGRLLLTPQEGWQVFGYDVASSRVPAGDLS